MEVVSKYFHKQKQRTINVKKVVVSDKVSFNNGKDWRYIAAYQVDGETIIPLFINTLKNILNYGVSQYQRAWLTQCSLMFLKPQSGVHQYKCFIRHAL